MESLWIVAIVAVIFLPPVFLFAPLVNAVANRIAGKTVDAKQFKIMQQKVENLEQQIAHITHRLGAVEETNEFSKKLLEDSKKVPEPISPDKT